MDRSRQSLVASISLAAGVAMGGCCCRDCYSQDARKFLVEPNRQEAPSANLYPLKADPLQPNLGTLEESENDKLVRIRGKAPNGDPREFDVFFGPREADVGKSIFGKGQFKNSDPTWECVQGYALIRGIRPSGSTQYVKATSPSTTLILYVDPEASEERVLLTEGIHAFVHLQNDPQPMEPNLKPGQVIVVKVANGAATMQPAIDYNTDKVSVDLLAYLEKVRGAKDVGVK
ncbi:MAG: hypothetical protein JNK58_10735 [Phycisphaerae bacterium]|nr:hypothetical protein [Phycisphaerae bacterium]